ncbi:MAG: hypothetical protein DRO87_01535 [Candidatus Thorarchaeota archaeon]|nr:MAG: hypothetical protein DRO87_01535 [Candidatus Thorarchaeota archaeon]
MGMEQSVALFSSQFGDGLLVVGMVWAFIVRIVSQLIGIRLDIFVWFILTMSAGAGFLLVWSFLKRRRFRNPVTNSELLSLFEETKRDLGIDRPIELWQRDIHRQVLLSTNDPLFKAILVSENTIHDLLEKREMAKVLLAKHMLRVTRRSTISQVAASVLGFTLFAFIESLAFFDVFEVLFMTAGSILLVGMVLAVVGILVVCPIFMSRRHDSIDERVEQLYGVSPAVAHMETIVGLKVPEEMIAEAKQERDEGEGPKKRALRKASIAAIVLALVTYMIMVFTWPQTTTAVFASTIMSIVVGAGTFAITYLTSITWPILAGGRGERSTEWDVQYPLASDVERFLNQYEEYRKVTVRGVRLPHDEQTGLVVLRLNEDYKEETIHAIMPQTVRDLQDVNLLGPLILAELRFHDIERREKRFSYLILGVGIPFLAVGMIWSFVVYGGLGMLSSLLIVLGVYTLITMAPLAYLFFWKKRQMTQAEIRTAKKHPGYVDALRILVERRYTLPYGKTSYRTRLERISRQLGLEETPSSSDRGLDIE